MALVQYVHDNPEVRLKSVALHILCACLGCRCDICQILRGWAKQGHLVKTKFILVGDMSQDHSVLEVGWKNVQNAGPDIFRSIQRCGLQGRLLDNLLADSRLILWVVASSQFTAHPKIISVPLGLLHPQEIKAAMKRRVGKRRKHLVGNTDGAYTTESRKRSQIIALVSAILPKGAFVRIPRVAMTTLDVKAVTAYDVNKQHVCCLRHEMCCLHSHSLIGTGSSQAFPSSF